MKVLRSFRFRLIFVTFLVEVIMLSILIFNSQRVIESYLVEQAYQNISNLKESFNSSLSRLLILRDYASIRSLMEQWLDNKDIAYMRIVNEGKQLISVGMGETDDLPLPQDKINLDKPVYQTLMPIIYEGQEFGQLYFGVHMDFLIKAKKDLFNQSAVIALSEIVLSAIILFGVGLFLTRKLLRLMEASKQVAEGNYDIELPKKGDDEIMQLSHAFAEMTGQVKEKIAELHQLNSHLQELVESEVEKVRSRDALIHAQARQAALSELLINLAHQWRQPLNVISLQADMVGELVESDDLDREKVYKSVNRIVEQTKSLSSTITYFTSINQKSDEVCRLDEAITAMQALLKESLQNLGVTLDVELCNCEIRCNTQIMAEIFRALVKNSLDAFEERNIRQGRIEIRCTSSETALKIIVSDNAGGIDSELLPKIFDPYSTSHFQYRNKGLGLYHVGNLVTHILEGSIRAENVQDGARITIEMEYA